MNADEILARTFADHEGEAPDADAVLADVHARLTRRRRAVPILAAAATVAAIAIGASVLVGQERPAPRPATGATPTPTGSNHTTPPDPTAEPDPLVRVPLARLALSAVTLDAGWLPPGVAENTELGLFYGRQTRAYNVTDSAGRTTRINFEVRSGSTLTPDDTIDRGPGRDLTLGGRPAREWQKDSVYLVVVRLPGNRVAQVDVTPMPDGTLDLAATGRHVATSLRFDRPTPIKPDFRPTYVPKGLAVRAVGRSDGAESPYWSLATPTAPPEGPSVSLGVDTRPGTSSTLPQPVVSGRPVQGHPTHLVPQAGNQVALYVDRFVGGKSLTINVTDKLVSVAELYKIADGVRLIG
jgi:hypothetical protein